MIDIDIQRLDWLSRKLFAGGAFAPEVENEDTAFCVLLAGAEFGYDPMASARAVQIVKGKVGLTADAQVAQCVKHADVCLYFRQVESTDKVATYTTLRAGSEPVTLSFTIDDARKAGLTSSMYTKYAAAMLRARCKSALARDVYPDLVGGTYDPDEIREIQAERSPAPATVTAVRAVPQLVEPAQEHAAVATYRARCAEVLSLDALVAVCLELAPTIADRKGDVWPIARGRAVDLGVTEEDFRAALTTAAAITKEPATWATVAAVVQGLDTATTTEAVAAVVRQHGAAVNKFPEALRAVLDQRRKARRAEVAAPPSAAAVLDQRLRAATTIPDLEALVDEITAAHQGGKITDGEAAALAQLQDGLVSALEREVAA